MPEAVIVDCVRTAVVRFYRGTLKKILGPTIWRRLSSKIC